MAISRTWNLRLNLDDFNAGFASLDGDEDLSQFLSGLSRGMNRGTARDSATVPFLAGFTIGHEMRVEAEALREAYAINGSKGGRPPRINPSDNPSVNPIESEGQPNRKPIESLSVNPLIPLTEEPRTTKLESTSPPRVGGRQKRVTKGGESLEEILHGGKGTPTWEAYWKLVSTFGGQSKNPAPKTSARLYVGALKAGTTAERIQNRADNLRKATSEEKFMPKLSTWLEGEGYLTPDLPKVAGGTGRAPSHRSAVDQEYLEQLAAMEPHQVETLAEEEMAEIWREPA